jgi:hypothetical protein
LQGADAIGLKYHQQTFTAMKRTTRNWCEYNAGLRQRGSLTFWLCEDVLEAWYKPTLRGKRVASQDYSDLAMITCVTLKSVYHQAGRQTQGLLESLFSLMDVSLEVPDHSTVSRRIGRLEVILPVVPKEGGIHLVVDSTGVKIYGEGEWKTHQHGWSKRRTWRKIFGGKLRARKFDNQAVGALLQCAALNRMTQIAKPDSILVEA